MLGAVAGGAGNMSVFSAAQHQLGRRLHLPSASSDRPLQPTTGGVIVFAGQKAYQITAWNPSFRRDKLSLESTLETEVVEGEVEVKTDANLTTDWDFEGSDLESDLGSDNESEGASETGCEAIDSRHPRNIECTAISFSPLGSTRHISHGATSSGLGENFSQQGEKGKSLEIPRDCSPIGKLAVASATWTEECDSCVLVELTGANASNIHNANTISHDSLGGGLRVRVSKPGKISNVAPSLAAIAAVAEHSAGCQLLTTPVLLTCSKNYSLCMQCNRRNGWRRGMGNAPAHT